MKYPFMAIWLILTAVFWSFPGKAEAVNVLDFPDEAIGTHISFLKENGAPLSMNEALKAYVDGKFQAGEQSILTFGIGSDPVWLGFEAVNSGRAPALRRISVETSWLDKVDIYYISSDGDLLKSHFTGDTQPFAARPVENRFFVFDYAFEPGATTVLMRVETPDPIVLPIYLTSIEQAQSRNTVEAYSHGFIYGALIALLAYNFILFLSLRNARYVLYSIYLSCFVLMNVAYTGHGFQWLWPDNPQWQLWSNIILMVAYSISGLLFATQFLETRQHFPRLHRLVMGSIFGVVFLSMTAVMADAHFAMVLLAFVYTFLFSPAMVLLGVVSVLAGIKFAKYFMFASIAAVTGAATTVLVVWGYIPYHIWAYRAIEIGMLIDAVLLALALADQFRISQREKNWAEKLAFTDPLTDLPNLRLCHDRLNMAVAHAHRVKGMVALMFIDLNKFKFINDTFGHDVGDVALKEVADRLQLAVREEDTVGRLGGDEFIIILNGISSKEDSINIARKIQSLLDDPIVYEDRHIQVGASIGISLYPDHGQTTADLLKSADKAMYQAKNESDDCGYALVG